MNIRIGISALLLSVLVGSISVCDEQGAGGQNGGVPKKVRIAWHATEVALVVGFGVMLSRKQFLRQCRKGFVNKKGEFSLSTGAILYPSACLAFISAITHGILGLKKELDPACSELVQKIKERLGLSSKPA